jgi:hypothetical protein
LRTSVSDEPQPPLKLCRSKRKFQLPGHKLFKECVGSRQRKQIGLEDFVSSSDGEMTCTRWQGMIDRQCDGDKRRGMIDEQFMSLLKLEPTVLFDFLEDIQPRVRNKYFNTL